MVLDAEATVSGRRVGSSARPDSYTITVDVPVERRRSAATR
ncbi:MAG TPA: hypothetical protein VKB93_16080 [Thermoanaerobaculia bacterium]|nr:hypothetical protein [Thermoanaerobaculia bacterium]